LRLPPIAPKACIASHLRVEQRITKLAIAASISVQSVSVASRRAARGRISLSSVRIWARNPAT
jgi:hypothetical protein